MCMQAGLKAAKIAWYRVVDSGERGELLAGGRWWGVSGVVERAQARPRTRASAPVRSLKGRTPGPGLLQSCRGRRAPGGGLECWLLPGGRLSRRAWKRAGR